MLFCHQVERGDTKEQWSMGRECGPGTVEATDWPDLVGLLTCTLQNQCILVGSPLLGCNSTAKSACDNVFKQYAIKSPG